MNQSDSTERDPREDLEDRRERARRRLGTADPCCANPGCHEDDPLALTGVWPQILCARCRARECGRSETELHHQAGRRNLPHVIRIPINEHRVLSARQEGWPKDTLRNPDGSLLLIMAAALRGWLDVLAQIIERSVGWIPDALERLDAALCERLGARWWDALGICWETAGPLNSESGE